MSNRCLTSKSSDCFKIHNIKEMGVNKLLLLSYIYIAPILKNKALRAVH